MLLLYSVAYLIGEHHSAVDKGNQNLWQPVQASLVYFLCGSLALWPRAIMSKLPNIILNTHSLNTC